MAQTQAGTSATLTALLVAVERQVSSQFLIEAIVLPLFGGLVGIVLGLGFATSAMQSARPRSPGSAAAVRSRSG